MSIAQTAAQRRRQVSVVKAVYRVADSAGEKFERKLKTYTNKRKLIEAKDMQPLVDLYKQYQQLVDSIQKSMTDLLTLVGK
jgi:hypothetical protein